MIVLAGKSYKRAVLFALLPILAICGLGVAGQLYFNKPAYATNSPSVIYSSLPSVTPQTNYASLGFQATSTSEFGDFIHLGGTNRVLNTVTVTMSDWAKFSDYSSNPTYSGNSTTWSMPITLNIYSSHLGADGVPDTKLATKTQAFDIPWRPESDPTCGPTSNGTGWIVNGVCYNYSGIASNITFDLSSLKVTLPNDVIVGVAYNTQTYGENPTGIAGPYSSLNVAIPANQSVTVGTDDNVDVTYWDTTYPGYTAGLKADSQWIPNGTVAFEITATAPIPPAVPTNLRLNNVNGEFACGGATNINYITPTWNAVSDASSYNYRVTLPSGSMYGPISVGNVTSVSGPFGAEGLSTFSVQAVDSNGLTSDWAAPCAIFYDKTLPDMPSLISTLNNGYEKTNNFYFTWSDESDSGSQVKYEFQSSNSNNLDGNGSLIGSWNSIINGNSEQNNLTSPKIHSTGAPDATYYWQIRTFDAAGNKSAWTAPWKMTIDTKAPDIPSLVSPLDNSFVKGSPTLINSWSAVSGAVKYIYESYNDASATTLRWHGEYTTNSKSAENVADTSFWWRVKAVDAAGNESGWSNLWKVTVDNISPTVDLVFTGTGSSATGFQAVFNEDVNLADVTDPANYFLANWPGAGGSGSLVDHATISYDSISHIATITFTTPGWYVSPEQQWGVQNVHDLAGNVISVNPLSEFSTPMVQPVTAAELGGTLGDNDYYKSDVTVDFNATDPAVGSGVKMTYYSIDGADFIAGSSVIVSTEGQHDVSFYSVDNAGNTESTKNVSFKIDKTAPVIKLVGDDVVTITVGGTYVDDGATAVDNIDNVITNMIISNSSVDSTKVGEYTVTYNVSDSAGNNANQASRLVKVVAKEIPAITTPSVLGATVTAPTVVRAASGEVLGATTTEAADDASEAKDISSSKSKNKGEVKGTSDSKNEDTPWYEANIMGFAWYWWALIVAAVAGLLWFILGRRRNENN